MLSNSSRVFLTLRLHQQFWLRLICMPTIWRVHDQHVDGKHVLKSVCYGKR